jgi:hypothetical protein
VESAELEEVMKRIVLTVLALALVVAADAPSWATAVMKSCPKCPLCP